VRLIARLRASVRSIVRRERAERDLDDELRFALDELASRHEARGIDPAAARIAARCELGHADLIKADIRSLGLAHAIDNLRRDIAYTGRALRRAPMFTAIVSLIVAGGVGPATAIFSIVNGLLIDPLPYRAPHELVSVWQDLQAAAYTRAPLSGPELRDLRRRSQTVEAFAGIWANTAALSDGPEPEQLRVGLVTANFFDVLGVEPVLGRSFRTDDDAERRPGIILSWEVWQRRYGGEVSRIGTTVPVNGRPTSILGVMPPGFRLLLAPDAAIPDDQQAWVLLGPNALNGPRQQQFLRTVGRIRAGVTLEAAQREIAALGDALGREHLEYGPQGLAFYAVPLQRDSTRAVRRALLGLLVSVFVLLAIGCVNVANLMAARSINRQHELQVRAALGASRTRLWRQALIEALLLSAAGGSLGLLFAIGLLEILLASRPPALARLDLAGLDWGVFGFACLVSFACGLLFSLAPVPQLLALPVSGPRTVTAHAGRGTFRNGLVTVEIALCGVLVITSALFARGFSALQQVPQGFVERNVVTFKVARSRTPSEGSAAGPISEVLRQRIAGLAGVSAVGTTSHLPFDTVPNWGSPFRVRAAGRTLEGIADARAVSAGYFDALSARVVSGRQFDERDRDAAPRVAIVDTHFAEAAWPDGTAVGRQLLADPLTTGAANVPVTVVGVLEHIRDREVARAGRPQIYFPVTQAPRDPLAYAVNTSRQPAELVREVKALLAELDASVPVYDVRPLSAYTSDAYALGAFTSVLLIAFAVSALALTAVGIYGISAFRAACRRREFGVRIAFGAGARQVALLVLRDAVRLAVIGSLAGPPQPLSRRRRWQRTSPWSVPTIRPSTCSAPSSLSPLRRPPRSSRRCAPPAPTPPTSCAASERRTSHQLRHRY
jgi:predicted permease